MGKIGPLASIFESKDRLLAIQAPKAYPAFDWITVNGLT
jgi:hypothetical protein